MASTNEADPTNGAHVQSLPIQSSTNRRRPGAAVVASSENETKDVELGRPSRDIEDSSEYRPSTPEETRDDDEHGTEPSETAPWSTADRITLLITSINVFVKFFYCHGLRREGGPLHIIVGLFVVSLRSAVKLH